MQSGERVKIEESSKGQRNCTSWSLTGQEPLMKAKEKERDAGALSIQQAFIQQLKD